MVGFFYRYQPSWLVHVIPGDNYLRSLASRINVFPVDVDLFLLARKQGEIVVAIEHREELLSILLSDYIHTDHQSWCG